MMIKVILIFLFASTTAFGQGSDKALRFDGNDYVQLPGQLLPVDGSAWSISCWTKPTVANNGNLNVFFAQYTNGDGRIHFYELNGSWVYFFGHTVGNVFQPFAPVDLNEWQHLAFVCNGTQVDCYKNGVLMHTAPITANIQPVPSRIGFDSHPFVLDRYFEGDIDEVRIWHRTLTQAEVQQQMCQPLQGSEPGLVAYYRMDEGADNTCSGGEDLCDASGNGNHGTKF